MSIKKSFNESSCTREPEIDNVRTGQCPVPTFQVQRTARIRRDKTVSCTDNFHQLYTYSLGMILTVVSIFALLSYGCNNNGQNDSPQQVSQAQRNVRVAQVERKTISAGIALTGRIESDIYANISPALGGKVKSIHVQKGQIVSEGDLLAELDDAQLIQAEQSFRNLERNYERVRQLLQTDAIDKKSYEEIETAYKIAKTSYVQALENTKIKAAIAGRVTAIAVKPGETYNPMMSPYLIRILSLDKIKGVTNISDRHYPLVKNGMTVTVQVEAYPDKYFDGKVVFISPEADMMSGMFRCEVLINDRNNLLRHNQFARLFINTEQRENSLVIPQQALIDDNTIFVAENGFARRRNVQTGISSVYEVEIIEGVSVDESVITFGNIGLADGFPINIID